MLALHDLLLAATSELHQHHGFCVYYERDVERWSLSRCLLARASRRFFQNPKQYTGTVSRSMCVVFNDYFTSYYSDVLKYFIQLYRYKGKSCGDGLHTWIPLVQLSAGCRRSVMNPDWTWRKWGVTGKRDDSKWRLLEPIPTHSFSFYLRLVSIKPVITCSLNTTQDSHKKQTNVQQSCLKHHYCVVLFI